MLRPLLRSTVPAVLSAGLLATTLTGMSAGVPTSSPGVPVSRTVTAAPSLSPAQQRVAQALRRRVQTPVLGRNTAGLVVDAHSGRTVWSHRAATPMIPASVTKLATAMAALDVLGRDSTVTTRVTQGSGRDEVVLVGAGDALLGTADVQRLAEITAGRLRTAGATRVSVVVDDSLFPAPTLAPGWKRGYYPSSVAPVRALIVDQREKYDTSLDAGGVFARALQRSGIAVAGVARGRSSLGAPQLAVVRSRPVHEWVARMLLVSDNDIAETLARLTSLRAGKRATWADSRAVRSRVLARYGVRPASVHLYDGSGLSRSNRMTAQGVIAVLRAASRTPALADLLPALPVAGRTGSLRAERGRFTTLPSRCAAGRVAAKTGLLTNVVTLAGVAPTADGRQALFVLMENGRPGSAKVKRAVDGLAATVTGCW